MALSSYCFSFVFLFVLLLCGEIIKMLDLLLICQCKIYERGSFPFWDMSIDAKYGFTRRNIRLITLSPFMVMVLQNHVFPQFLLSPAFVSRSSSCNFHLTCSSGNIFLYLFLYFHSCEEFEHTCCARLSTQKKIPRNLAGTSGVERMPSSCKYMGKPLSTILFIRAHLQL